MLPARAIVNRVPNLLRDDDANLNNPAEPLMSIRAVAIPFTPNPELVLADLTFNTDVEATSIIEMDPLDNQQILFSYPEQFPVYNAWPLENSFQFAPFGITYPSLVYGFAMVGNGGTVLFATESFPEPVTFTMDDQVWFNRQPLFTFPDSMWR